MVRTASTRLWVGPHSHVSGRFDGDLTDLELPASEVHRSPWKTGGLTPAQSSATAQIRFLPHGSRAGWAYDVSFDRVPYYTYAEHVSGVTNEAETECYARQNVRRLALRLGVKPGQAAILGRYAGRRARMPPRATRTEQTGGAAVPRPER